MSGQDFVRQLVELAARAVDGASLDRTMSVARMSNVHYRPDHHRSGRIIQENRSMTIRNLQRRLDQIGSADGGLGFTQTLEAARQKARAWRAAGNSGLPPPAPLGPPPPEATRAQREVWRKIAEGCARVVHCRAQPSPFHDLSDIYGMSDDDLVPAVNQARST